MTEQDYIIVGQGIAGALLAYFLRKNGQKVVVIDGDTEGVLSASKIAAGVINPITGRRFVKSWRIDELLPSAKRTYQELEKVLNVPLWHDRSIIRTLRDTEEENNFLLRRTYPDYAHFCGETSTSLKEMLGLSNFKFQISDFKGETNASLKEMLEDSANLSASCFHSFPAFADIKNGAQVNLPLLVAELRAYFIKNQCFIKEKFSAADLIMGENFVTYKNSKAKKIIFAEGAAGATNPYFSWLPFNLDKGELLLVRIPDLNVSAIFKNKISIVPLHDVGFGMSDFGNAPLSEIDVGAFPKSQIQNPKSLYWVGATNAWTFDNALPTEVHKQLIINELQEILNCPFEVIAHRAAIRPTVRDRRPFIGLHPQLSVLGIFNGFGTKGASLIPFFAEQFVDSLLNDKPLEKEVDIRRFHFK
jgi:glycine oxidase